MALRSGGRFFQRANTVLRRGRENCRDTATSSVVDPTSAWRQGSMLTRRDYRRMPTPVPRHLRLRDRGRDWIPASSTGARDRRRDPAAAGPRGHRGWPGLVEATNASRAPCRPRGALSISLTQDTVRRRGVARSFRDAVRPDYVETWPPICMNKERCLSSARYVVPRIVESVCES